MDLSPRLRAVCDLDVAEMREYSGRHEYDGKPQDLSPDGVRAGLARLAAARAGGERLADPHDEAQLAAAEDLQRVAFAELELHRRNPILHLDELDLACLRPGLRAGRGTGGGPGRAPGRMAAARRRGDRIPGPGQRAGRQALLGAVRGLAAGLGRPVSPAGRRTRTSCEAALAAHARLVAHVERAAADGDPDAALGGPALSALMGSAEALPVDLAGWPSRPTRNGTGCTPCWPRAAPARPGPGPRWRWPGNWSATIRTRTGVIEAARLWTQRAIDFTREHDLVPYHDGVCLVGPAPESRRWAMAMMSSAAPGEPEGPSWYHITPPDESWPEREQRGVAGGLQRHDAARHHRARGRARPLLAWPRAAAADLAGPADRCTPARSSRAGRTTPRSCAWRRASAPTTRGSRSASGWRRWSG